MNPWWRRLVPSRLDWFLWRRLGWYRRRCSIPLRRIVGTVEMTGDIWRRVVDSQGHEGAFVDFMERELPKMAQRMIENEDRVRFQLTPILDDGMAASPHRFSSPAL